MAFDFSTLIIDRTAADVAAMNSKGTYNASDMNRVGAAVACVAELLAGYGYIANVSPKTDWTESDIPTVSQLEIYRQNIATLRETIAMTEDTPETPKSMDRLGYVTANAIEQILLDLDTLILNMTQAWFYSGDLYAGET